MNCVAQEASFWSNTNSILLTYVLLSGAVLGESWYFQALIVGLQKPGPASPLFPYSNVCADLHLTIAHEHPLPVVWDEDHSLVCALTSIWLFMELSRGKGKPACRPVRLKGWASFFLAKKEKPLTVPGPPRVAEGLRESLARIMQINVYHWAGQEETMKQFHALLPRLEGLLASLLPAHWRLLLGFACFS